MAQSQRWRRDEDEVSKEPSGSGPPEPAGAANDSERAAII